VIVIPAIDLRGGRCVRLRQGDYARETVYGDDPLAMARHWVSQGATWLHLVDLDGAKDGRSVNGEAVRAIAREAGAPCQLGGGLRSEEDLEAAFAWGVHRLIVGTQAFREPDWFARMCKQFPGRLLLGLDAKDGRVATHGWLAVSDCDAVEFVRRVDRLPLAGVVYTDIGRDGMLAGPDERGIGAVAKATRHPLYAAAGVTTLADVQRLADLPVAGCIVGRAIYEGTLSLHEAIHWLTERGTLHRTE
jgi:phosphoribosylformimino-5-aminoimidazole carboxamide ribotide isomerase